MIKPKTFERVLRNWEPWLKAIRDARQDGVSISDNVEAWWSYAKKVLIGLRLPSKPMMCLYFLSCVFSPDTGGSSYSFGEIKLPQMLYDKYDEFVARLKRTMWCKMVFDFMAIRPPRQWPDFKAIGGRPTPPAVWHKADVLFIGEWESHQCSGKHSIAETIRTFYSPCYIMLPPDHPLLQIGSKIKRKTDEELAIRCAVMKETGYTYKQIGEEFGWALQENSYGKLIRCSTARRYVQRGRELSEK